MSVRVVVPATRIEYRAVVAELPVRTRAAAQPSGAIVVVTGDEDWIEGTRTAIREGALVVVVADPRPAEATAIRRLAGEAAVPVILERPRLRPDAAADATAIRLRDAVRAAPRIVTVDGAGPRAALPGLLCDAVGWARILSGGALAVVSAGNGLALLECRASAYDAGAVSPGSTVPVTVTAVAAGMADSPGWVRARALGELVIEADVDARGVRVEAATAAGRHVAPTRYESSPRLALRRALDALAGEPRPSDLDELAADSALVARLGVFGS